MRNLLLPILCVGLIGCQEGKVGQKPGQTASVSTAEEVLQDSGGSEKLTVEFTSANFQKEVLESDKVVLVDFWAPS